MRNARLAQRNYTWTRDNNLLIAEICVIFIKSRKGTWMQKLEARRQQKKSGGKGGIGKQKLTGNQLPHFPLIKGLLINCHLFSSHLFSILTLR